MLPPRAGVIGDNHKLPHFSERSISCSEDISKVKNYCYESNLFFLLLEKALLSSETA